MMVAEIIFGESLALLIVSDKADRSQELECWHGDSQLRYFLDTWAR
jgi:hypothetical protein